MQVNVKTKNGKKLQLKALVDFRYRNLGTWPIIVGIGGREEEWQKGGDWNMEEEVSREICNIQTI